MKRFILMAALLLTACGTDEQATCFTFTPTGEVFDADGNPVTDPAVIVNIPGKFPGSHTPVGVSAPQETTVVCAE
jgi:hypothetical protein